MKLDDLITTSIRTNTVTTRTLTCSVCHKQYDIEERTPSDLKNMGWRKFKLRCEYLTCPQCSSRIIHNS